MIDDDIDDCDFELLRNDFTALKKKLLRHIGIEEAIRTATRSEYIDL
jgi:hypothetical protein